MCKTNLKYIHNNIDETLQGTFHLLTCMHGSADQAVRASWLAEGEGGGLAEGEHTVSFLKEKNIQLTFKTWLSVVVCCSKRRGVLLLLKELFSEAAKTLSVPAEHITNAQLIWQKQLSGESVGHFAFSVIVINRNPQYVEFTKTLLSDTKDQRSLSESDLIYNCYHEFLWDGVAFRGSLWEGKLSSKILFLDF